MREAEATAFGPAAPANYRSVFANRGFLLLWLSYAIGQTAQMALLFTLLVLVVAKTGSAAYGSFLVLSFTVPALILGMGAGVVVDRWPKHLVLNLSMALRGLLAIAFWAWAGNVWIIYALTMAFASTSQFATPAAIAFIPTVISRRLLITANGLFQLTITGSQFVGMVILAPILLKPLGADGVFVAAALLFGLSTLAMSLLPSQEQPSEILVMGDDTLGELRQSWRLLQRDPKALVATAQLTISSTLILFFAVGIPRYMHEVLVVGPDNAAFVFAPFGLGALVGLRLLPWLDHKLSRPAVATLGLVGIALFLILFALIEPLANLLEKAGPLNPFAENRIGGLSILVGLSMTLSAPLGLAYALVNAPAQTVLHERAPEAMRGRIFATQTVLANIVSLGPLLLLGTAADLLGVSTVLLLVAAFVLGGALFSTVLSRYERIAVAAVDEATEIKEEIDVHFIDSGSPLR